ncbi:hypothetical protein MMC22_007683 [Lobaria immixta]|nr:hypothetical protein [Lobaria immixta]
MADESALRGACSCGRNQYVIVTSFSPEETSQVLLEEKADQGRVLSLRVPLARFRSTTHAFYPDETHNAIRRVFSPRNAPHSKRHFCGFCGSQLTYWSEEPREEADWVYISIGSLKSESLEKLEEAGLLAGTKENEKAETSDGNGEKKETVKRKHNRELIGTPWFEEMIQGSELGKVKRRRGGQSSLDGKSKVEWEIVEFTADDEENSIVDTGKRKINVSVDDVEMKG